MLRLLLALLVAAAGCSDDVGKPSQFVVPSGQPRAGSGESGPGASGSGAQSGEGGGAGDEGAAPGPDSGLPCEVDAMLAMHCRGCHRSPPVAGAPMALLTYDDLVAPAVSDASRRVADLAIERVERGEMPPPPNAAVPAESLTALTDWVEDGAMRASCDAPVTADAGMPVDPFDTPTVCTSGEYWEDGDDGDERMHPGGPCVSCHAESDDEDEAPALTIGGTVYPSAHEPTDCNGVDGEDDVEVSVVITGADGNVLTLEVNDVGNFYTTAAVALPFNAKVVAGGRERHMVPAQMTGNCNGCHTEDGDNDAPGRIMAP